MAVTRSGQIIHLGAAGDAVTGPLAIQAIMFNNTAEAQLILQDTASFQICKINTEEHANTHIYVFPKALMVEGIKASTMASGTCTIYLIP